MSDQRSLHEQIKARKSMALSKEIYEKAYTIARAFGEDIKLNSIHLWKYKKDALNIFCYWDSTHFRFHRVIVEIRYKEQTVFQECRDGGKKEYSFDAYIPGQEWENTLNTAYQLFDKKETQKEADIRKLRKCFGL